MTNLIMGREREPVVAFVYGVPGVGKSTFAAGAPNPIFVGPERNKEINALKFPQNQTHAQLMDYLREIEKGKQDKHNIRSVVLDAITTEEKVINQEIVKSEPGKTMETARKGYGKAWAESLTKLYEIREQLQTIADKKEMNIIVLAHSIKAEFSDPLLMTSYDTYKPALHVGKKFDHNSVFIDWASSVLFLTWKAYATEDRQYATAIGKREIKTEYRPSHIAKNRYNLPETIEMDMANPLNTFGIFMSHVERFYASGELPNTQANDLAILQHKTKELFSKVSDSNQSRQAIESALDSEWQNFINLKVIHDRLKEIVDNQ